MDAELEAQSTLALAHESENWQDLRLSPEHLLSPEPCLDPPPREPSRGRLPRLKASGLQNRLNRSLDLSVDLVGKSHSKLGFPHFARPKPSVLAMILKDKSSISLAKTTSECNVWHNPKVPRFLLRYMLSRPPKPLPEADSDWQLAKGPIRKLAVPKPAVEKPQKLPPLQGARCMRRTESCLY